MSGLALGTVLGVPAGLLLADAWGWRATIILITIVGALALAGIAARGGELPSVPASTPAQRLRSLTRPANLLTVLVTLLTAAASLGFYTYVALVLAPTPLGAHQVAAIWVWDIGGAVGALSVGRLIDRTNPLRLSVAILAGLLLAILTLAVGHGAALLLLALFLWGLFGWASLAPQQHVLLATNPDDGATAVAANASANYLGSALGAVFGSALVSTSDAATTLPCAAVVVALAALLTQIVRSRRPAAN